MCEINPKHTKIYRLEYFTTHPTMSKAEFDHTVAGLALLMEMRANETGMIRCHVHEHEDDPARFADFAKLEQAFKDATGRLPNYKRSAAWEFINALKQEIVKREHEVREIADHNIELHNRLKKQEEDKIAGQILTGGEPEE